MCDPEPLLLRACRWITAPDHYQGDDESWQKAKRLTVSGAPELAAAYVAAMEENERLKVDLADATKTLDQWAVRVKGVMENLAQLSADVSAKPNLSFDDLMEIVERVTRNIAALSDQIEAEEAADA